jgi:hypothetical protein
MPVPTTATDGRYAQVRTINMPLTAAALAGIRPAGIIHRDFKASDVIPGIDITQSILPAVFHKPRQIYPDARRGCHVRI